MKKFVSATRVTQFGLVLGLLSMLTIACKKDDDDVNPLDAFVGSYTIEESDCYEEDKLRIEKDEKTLILNSKFFRALDEEDVKAEVSGNTFELEPFDATVTDENGQSVTFEISGEGEVNGKDLTLEIDFNGQTACEFEGQKN